MCLEQSAVEKRLTILQIIDSLFYINILRYIGVTVTCVPRSGEDECGNIRMIVYISTHPYLTQKKSKIRYIRTLRCTM